MADLELLVIGSLNGPVLGEALDNAGSSRGRGDRFRSVDASDLTRSLHATDIDDGHGFLEVGRHGALICSGMGG